MQTITKNAGIDDLTEQDYMDILEELLQTHTLRELTDVLHSEYSFAYWSKIRRGEGQLVRKGKNELRGAMKLPPLPPTIEEATAQADPNSEVRRIGSERPDLIYMLNRTETGELSPVTGVTAVVASPQWANERKNDKVFNMTSGVLGWKIRNRVEL